MRARRSTARINLRFSNMEEMDLAELTANREGLSLQDWLRQLVFREIFDKQVNRVLREDLFLSISRIEFIVEKLAPEHSNSANEYAANRYEALRAQARDA